MIKFKNLTAVILLLTFCLANIGCPPPAERPEEEAELAPEVEKYTDEEPTISLYRKDTGETEHLPIEEYLKGVVAAEIGKEFPMEAMKAQAIIARTMTLALIEFDGGTQDLHGTDASDDHTEFQAYSEEEINEDIERAVQETRGQVITYDGNFIWAMFHSLSDDLTASREEGFPGIPEEADAYLQPVDTKGMENAPEEYIDWTVNVPVSEVQQIMGEEAGNLEDIEVSERGPSGRATEISAGEATIQAIDLRQEIGFDTLYSTIIEDIEVEDDNVVFRGTGWGHGVGMEQWGAYTMAENDKTAKEIVEHYFSGTTWTDLWE
ncbi:Stage II sporulation protein D (SpoIID) [Candidatus Syntrophocurvum alkaliphilum]|uniref:Stage II sporulation protein D (SpoIID) n=1 Tax=Candidatus Syntrophocurvum alkaliphilum TaxID=2293317 RepID=A0A6I6DJB4_9FIRM|nr:SpoIID/LytB domain-containing protein [Candidatus Syntrophocurvum alkaliphilum]QGU00874.1 Stage II sporulation protein D (SpoIID) [Candidatus Syntrophocurvum alkaliphilum]